MVVGGKESRSSKRRSKRKVEVVWTKWAKAIYQRVAQLEAVEWGDDGVLTVRTVVRECRHGA